MNLFEQTESSNQPLAARMRPQTVEQFIGQEHIMGEGRLLRRLIQADRISSLLFYGPPGTGKTTLASVIDNLSQSRFVILNAVLSGVQPLRKELKIAAEQQSLYGKRTILFIDEVHRWNKSQQDALLPWVENGTVILIGATTENPYFEVNPALVSRSRIFRLKKLTRAGMEQVLQQALEDPKRGYGNISIQIDSEAKAHLIKTADGDARNLLNALELAVETTPDSFPPPTGVSIHITLQIAEESIQQKAVLYDKEGDYHYDIISAFIKSIRGSDPDATLYWLSRMVHAGEDPRFIFRRMLISACEDVGLADPNAIGVVDSLASAFDRVGLPEGRYVLTEAALYLATAKKSNSTMGFFDALASVANEESREVPNHLKDTGRDSKSFGHGKGYLYPHAFRDHWVAQQYLPSGLQGRIYYHPTKQGYEAHIRESVLRRREIQLEKAFDHAFEENYSWSSENRRQSEWLRRTEQKDENLLLIRDRLIHLAQIKRHHRVLIAEEKSALLYWEAFRQAPEGGVYLLSDQQKITDHIHHYFKENEIDDLPLIIEGNRKNLEGLKEWHKQNSGVRFDLILGRHLLSGSDSPRALIQECVALMEEGGALLFSQRDFQNSTSFSDLLKFARQRGRSVASDLFDAVIEAETSLFKQETPYGGNLDQLTAIASDVGLVLKANETVSYNEQISISPQWVKLWSDSNRLGYGEKFRSVDSVESKLLKAVNGLNFEWKRSDNLYRFEKI